MSSNGPDPVIVRKAGGRPRNAEPSATVSTWVPATTHDRLIEVAKRQGCSVSEMVRRVLVLTLRAGAR